MAGVEWLKTADTVEARSRFSGTIRRLVRDLNDPETGNHQKSREKRSL